MTYCNSASVKNFRRQTVVMSWIMDQSLEQILVNYVRVIDQGHPRHRQVGFIPRRAAISEFDSVRYYHVDFEDGCSDRMSQNQLQQIEYQAR